MNKKVKGEEKYDLTLKVVILGSHGTGKSSLVHVLSKETEVPKKIAKAPVGLETFVYECPQIPKKKIKIALWDIALGDGNERLLAYLQRTFAIILIFDWSNAKSFAEMKDAFQLLTSRSKEFPFSFPIAVAHIQTRTTSEVTTKEFDAFNNEAIKYIPYVGFYNLSFVDTLWNKKAHGMFNRLLSDYNKRKEEYLTSYPAEKVPNSAPVILKEPWNYNFIICTFIGILFVAFAYFATLYYDDFWFRVVSLNSLLIVIALWIFSFKMLHN